MLVVTFDENGGIYDQKFPPTTTLPNPEAPPVTKSTFGRCGNNWKLNSTIDFSLLGLRVPALLISPWQAKGIDSNLYQNTSVTRFLVDRMNAVYGTKARRLTSRDKTTPALDSAFTQFGQIMMRLDYPGWVASYSTLPPSCKDPSTNSNAIPYSNDTLTAWNPPPGTDNAAPVPYRNELMNIYVGSLQEHPGSRKKITRNFTTNAEVRIH